MTKRLAIGDFARATHVTVKALRHYHEIGLLPPVAIDPESGYRYYAADQISRAQFIRRLRELDMPLSEIQAALDAPTAAGRDRTISDHLRRMEQELERTREVVSSLHDLLQAPHAPVAITWQAMPAVRAVAICATVERAAIQPWCERHFTRLFTGLNDAGIPPSGPSGALFAGDFFTRGAGPVTAFVPVETDTSPPAGTEIIELPSAQLAVAVHEGPYDRLDQTYGALADVVAESGLGLDAPIRERYLVSVPDTDDPMNYRTEVCWPVAER